MAARKHSRSFDILSGYDGYFPDVKGIFILLALLFAGAAVGMLVLTALQKFCGNGFADSYGMLVTYPLQFLPAMLYASSKSSARLIMGETFPVDTNRFAPVGGFWLALMVSIGTLALAVVCEPVMAILPEMPEYLKHIMENLSGGPLWVALLTAAVFAPFFEEWICRGMVLRGMLQKISPFWAIIISAAFFALIHLNPWQAIPAFLIGCLFGLVYYKTGSLKLTMLMHCINNSFSILLSRIPRFADSEYLWDAIGDQRLYSILYIACLALVILLTVRLLKTDFKELS